MTSSSRLSLIHRPIVAAALAALVVTGASVGSAGAVTAQDATPTMSISPGVAQAGDTITVSVAGWPEGSASVAVCGDQASVPEADCDRTGARSVDVDADGTGVSSLVVAPPVDCPCVVRVAADQSDLVQTLPLKVPGAADAAPGSTAPTVAPAPVAATTTTTHADRPAWAAVVVVLGLVIAVAVGLSSWARARRRRSDDEQVTGR